MTPLVAVRRGIFERQGFDSGIHRQHRRKRPERYRPATKSKRSMAGIVADGKKNYLFKED